MALWYGFKHLLGQTKMTILRGDFCLKLVTSHEKFYIRK